MVRDDSWITPATARDFDAYMKRFPELYRDLAGHVSRYVTVEHPVLVDIGCGSGLLACELQGQFRSGTVLGLDPMRQMLALAKENARDTGCALTLLQGVSEALPLASTSVDAITSRFSLPYWPRPEHSFREMYRVLKPGGVMVLDALNREFPRWKLRAIGVQMRVKKAGFDVMKYHVDAYDLAHTREQVHRYFTGAGFHIVETLGRPKEWKFLVVARKPPA